MVLPVQSMPALACGVDIVELAGMERAVRVGQAAFLRRICTEREVMLAQGRIEALAAYFAVKEAVAKALGTGIRGITWHQIELMTDHSNQLSLQLHAAAATLAARAGLSHWHITLGTGRHSVIALVIASQQALGTGMLFGTALINHHTSVDTYAWSEYSTSFAR